MPQDKRILDALNRAGSIIFPANQDTAEDLGDKLATLKKTEIDGTVYRHTGDQPSTANTRVKIYPTGHTVFYDDGGKRFLMTDPGGTPLHEAEWAINEESGKTELVRARMQLDSRQWVGVKPKAKTFQNQIDLKDQPGWQDMTLDFLRERAAEAWRVPFSEVKYFYPDENLIPLGEGKFEVRLTKDGLYALPNGNFDQPLFMSFMFQLNWAELATIPVVELFQSALPGSGGAVFEFIWGLCEDQERDGTSPRLRYRGLPTYPSNAAYNIFSSFFTPQAPEGEEDIVRLFMDTNRSHEVTWTRKPHPPWRYFHDIHKIALTIQENFLYKVTAFDDPTPSPFINCARGGSPTCERELQVAVGSFYLIDGELTREIPFEPQWKITPNSDKLPAQVQYPFSWKWFFNGYPPKTDPIKSLYTLPFYPEGPMEIDESALQPLALDQIIYYMEMSPAMPGKLEKIERVLVHTFDMVLAGCIDCTHERQYTVLFGDPELATKNARQLWDYAVSRKELENLKKVSFMSEQDFWEDAYKDKYDMIFKWVPMMFYQERETCEKILHSVVDALLPGGILFLVGPRPIRGLFDHYNLESYYSDPMMNMPFFRQHLKMCPENLINENITVFMAEKRTEEAQKEKEKNGTQAMPTEVTTDIPIRDFSRPN